MLVNSTSIYLSLCSSLHSPLLTSTKSSMSYTLANCKFNRFLNNMYRSSASLIKEHVQIKKTKVSYFLSTPLLLSPDYSGELIEERIFIGPTDEASNLTIIDCQFKNIVSDDRGAAIRIAKHTSLSLNNSNFFNCVSRYEAAILFVLIGKDTWSLAPININRCLFEECYSTGQYFTILDNYTDKYPSVLIHNHLGFRYTSIESNIQEVTSVNCQENEFPKKQFGAYIHYHANTFSIKNFNCSNNNKIDSSQIFFTQSHKQASNVMYILAKGQVGSSLIEIKDIQSTDQLTFQNIDIYNSTLLTEEPIIINGQIEYTKSESGIINFGGDYSGSIVFIYCSFFDIYTDNKSIEPVLVYSSNGRLPIFANCFSNIQSIAENRGFIFTTPFESSLAIPAETPTATTVQLPLITTNEPTTTTNEINIVKNKDNTKNIIVVILSIALAIIVTVSTLVITRKYLSHNITFIDETDDSNYYTNEIKDTAHLNSIYGAEEPYIE